jgi:hypothetical protein
VSSFSFDLNTSLMDISESSFCVVLERLKVTDFFNGGGGS